MANVAADYGVDEYSSREQLFEQNLSLVKTIAHHISVRLPPGHSVDDLIQVGLIGLLEAARVYDSSLGAAFKSYESIRVRGSIMDELRRQSWVTRYVQKKSRELSQAIHKVENRLGRTAKAREVAEELNESLDEYSGTLEAVAGCTVFSLDDENNFHEQEGKEGSPFQDIQDESVKQRLADVISKLPDQEKMVIALYYDNELNLREIGEVLDVSESRVCQIHSQAVARMRSRMKEWIETERFD